MWILALLLAAGAADVHADPSRRKSLVRDAGAYGRSFASVSVGDDGEINSVPVTQVVKVPDEQELTRRIKAAATARRHSHVKAAAEICAQRRAARSAREAALVEKSTIERPPTPIAVKSSIMPLQVILSLQGQKPPPGGAVAMMMMTMTGAMIKTMTADLVLRRMTTGERKHTANEEKQRKEAESTGSYPTMRLP